MSLPEVDLTSGKIFSKPFTRLNLKNLRALNELKYLFKKETLTVSVLEKEYGLFCIRCGGSIFYSNKSSSERFLQKMNSYIISEQEDIKELCDICSETYLSKTIFDSLSLLKRKTLNPEMINKEFRNNFAEYSEKPARIRTEEELCSKARKDYVVWARKNDVNIWD